LLTREISREEVREILFENMGEKIKIVSVKITNMKALLLRLFLRLE